MRNKIILVVLLFTLIVMTAFAQSTFSVQPIKVDESDALKIQIAYQQVLSAQTQLDNAILRAKLKYKVPGDWNFEFDRGSFVPPAPPQPPPQQKSNVEKPK